MKKYAYKNLCKGKVLLIQDFESFGFAIGIMKIKSVADDVVVLRAQFLFWGIEVFLHVKEKW